MTHTQADRPHSLSCWVSRSPRFCSLVPLLLRFSGPISLIAGPCLSAPCLFHRELIDIEQSPAKKWDTFSIMSVETHIDKVERDGEDGLIVTFSDGTTCGYVVEELLDLRPIRERVKEIPVVQ